MRWDTCTDDGRLFHAAVAAHRGTFSEFDSVRCCFHRRLLQTCSNTKLWIITFDTEKLFVCLVQWSCLRWLRHRGHCIWYWSMPAAVSSVSLCPVFSCLFVMAMSQSGLDMLDNLLSRGISKENFIDWNFLSKVTFQHVKSTFEIIFQCFARSVLSKKLWLSESLFIVIIPIVSLRKALSRWIALPVVQHCDWILLTFVCKWNNQWQTAASEITFGFFTFIQSKARYIKEKVAELIRWKEMELVEKSELNFEVFVFSGEIFDYLITNGRMKESDVRAKFRQVLFCWLNVIYIYMCLIYFMCTVYVFTQFI